MDQTVGSAKSTDMYGERHMGGHGTDIYLIPTTCHMIRNRLPFVGAYKMNPGLPLLSPMALQNTVIKNKC
jgi:hypothetical protein